MLLDCGAPMVFCFLVMALGVVGLWCLDGVPFLVWVSFRLCSFFNLPIPVYYAIVAVVFIVALVRSSASVDSVTFKFLVFFKFYCFIRLELKY